MGREPLTSLKGWGYPKRWSCLGDGRPTLPLGFGMTSEEDPSELTDAGEAGVSE